MQAVSVFSSLGLEDSVQAGSTDQFKPANKLPEQAWGAEQQGANPFHQPSDGNNPSQPMSLQAGEGKGSRFHS